MKSLMNLMFTGGKLFFPIFLFLYLGLYISFVFAQEQQQEAKKDTSPLPNVAPEQRAKDEFSVSPTPFEIETAEKQVKQMFQRILLLWQEERYFEIYQMGAISSQKTVNEQDFATRMVKNSYLPEKPKEEQKIDLKFQYRSMIYATTRLQFKHKTNSNIRFIKPHQFLLMFENGAWRIDLIQILRSPFYSAFPAEPVNAPKNKNQ